jgi:hypothetical protein
MNLPATRAQKKKKKRREIVNHLFATNVLPMSLYYSANHE